VKRIADVQPDYVRMSGRLGSKMEKKVTITPTDEFPFKIKGVKTREKDNIRFSYRSTGRGYELTVTNTYSKEGGYDDEIIITTDNPKVPNLRIPVNAYILAPEPGEK
jgi:hypothetical protein